MSEVSSKLETRAISQRQTTQTLGQCKIATALTGEKTLESSLSSYCRNLILINSTDTKFLCSLTQIFKWHCNFTQFVRSFFDHRLELVSGTSGGCIADFSEIRDFVG